MGVTWGSSECDGVEWYSELIELPSRGGRMTRDQLFNLIHVVPFAPTSQDGG